MSVYKEGFLIVKEIQQNSVRIFNDACDFGAPVKKGDKLWNHAKQLVEWYGVKGSREACTVGVTHKVELMDEWAVSDGRKTEEQATEFYHISYCKTRGGKCSGFDGFIYIDQIK